MFFVCLPEGTLFMEPLHMASFNPTEERHIKTLKIWRLVRRGCPGGDAKKLSKDSPRGSDGSSWGPGSNQNGKNPATKKKSEQPVLVVKCGENVVCFDSMLVDLLSKIGNFYT